MIFWPSGFVNEKKNGESEKSKMNVWVIFIFCFIFFVIGM
jgi:hypothetical protein